LAIINLYVDKITIKLWGSKASRYDIVMHVHQPNPRANIVKSL